MEVSTGDIAPHWNHPEPGLSGQPGGGQWPAKYSQRKWYGRWYLKPKVKNSQRNGTLGRETACPRLCDKRQPRPGGALQTAPHSCPAKGKGEEARGGQPGQEDHSSDFILKTRGNHLRWDGGQMTCDLWKDLFNLRGRDWIRGWMKDKAGALEISSEFSQASKQNMLRAQEKVVAVEKEDLMTTWDSNHGKMAESIWSFSAPSLMKPTEKPSLSLKINPTLLRREEKQHSIFQTWINRLPLFWLWQARGAQNRLQTAAASALERGPPLRGPRATSGIILKHCFSLPLAVELHPSLPLKRRQGRKEGREEGRKMNSRISGTRQSFIHSFTHLFNQQIFLEYQHAWCSVSYARNAQVSEDLSLPSQNSHLAGFKVGELEQE